MFDGPQNWQLVKHEHFNGTMTELQNNAWSSFKNTIIDFFKIHMNMQMYAHAKCMHTEIVQKLLERLQKAWLQHEHQYAFFTQPYCLFFSF